MIFVDSNIPMYLVGAAHPNRAAATATLRRLVADRERLVTSAEVHQEILHRYRALERLDAADDAVTALDGLVDEVMAVTHAHVLAALHLLHDLPALSARDAVHVAVMKDHDIDRILTFDTGFDHVTGLQRLP